MARMMTRIIFLCSMLAVRNAPCLPFSHAPCSMLAVRNAPCLPCSMLHACAMLHAYAMLHACRAQCSMLPYSMLPCSILILSATGIMGYPTIISYHDMIPVKSHTMGYPIPMFIPYLFERYGIYPSRSYTISYHSRYNMGYPIEYTISFRYVLINRK